MSKPLVSIIINCYNGEDFLDECIQSVISQNYKNWEVIFWDNKSTDRSAEIFNSYRDTRLKYFCATEHTSLYKARNLAIEKSKGELIAFIDCDDLWESKKLNLQVPIFDNPDVSLVYSNLWLLKKNLKNKKKFIRKKSPSGYIYKKLLSEYNLGIITAVFRKKVLKNMKKIFDERFSIIGDFDFFLKLSKDHYFHYIDTPLAYYRIHEKNYSALYKEKEMEEFNIWANENSYDIDFLIIKKMKDKISLRKLLHFKFNQDYKNCYKILVQNYKSLLIIKMLIIVFTPLYILRKISWFHN